MPSRGFSRRRGGLSPTGVPATFPNMTTRTSPSLPSAPAELDRWRRETPGCRDRIHLNNAGAALMPQAVLQAVTAHLEREAAIACYEAHDEAARQGQTIVEIA